MAFKASTGLRDDMLDTGSLKGILDGGFIKIYSGPEPADADAAIGSGGTNVLLCTVSVSGGGGGLNLDTAAVSGAITKALAEVWKGTNAASGTASFYRHVTAADDGASSTTQQRIQGSIGTSGKELNLSDTGLTSGAEQAIDHYVISLPTL
jgi:hypothetical protein